MRWKKLIIIVITSVWLNPLIRTENFNWLRFVVICFLFSGKWAYVISSRYARNRPESKNYQFSGSQVLLICPLANCTYLAIGDKDIYEHTTLVHTYLYPSCSTEKSRKIHKYSWLSLKHIIQSDFFGERIGHCQIWYKHSCGVITLKSSLSMLVVDSMKTFTFFGTSSFI